MMFGMAEQPSLVAPTSRSDEVAAKLALVRGLLDRLGLLAIVLNEPGPVAWLSGGITNRIEPGSPASPLWLVVTHDAAAAVTTNVEYARLQAESGLPELGIELHTAPWHEPGGLERAAEALTGARAEEIGGLGVDVADDLVELRLALSAAEIERLSSLGTDAAWALENALRVWQPGELDVDVQARVAAQLERAGAFGACLIVGGDERVERFRHPLANGQPMRRLVMAVVVAERGGLHAAATRFASAEGLTPELRHARACALAVEEATLDACTPGATYGDVLRALDAAYADAGRPGAWADHYQGGPVGYRQREFEIVPTQTRSRWYTTPIEAGHALAWNPSVAGGGKAEDTYLVREDGLQRLTETGEWPLEAGRPAVLDINTGGAAL
jgi:Xaa-Pro aminopeptidase